MGVVFRQSVGDEALFAVAAVHSGDGDGAAQRPEFIFIENFAFGVEAQNYGNFLALGG